MKSKPELEQILSDLRTQLKKGRHQYWVHHAKQDYDYCENISAANACLRAKIEVIEMILTD